MANLDRAEQAKKVITGLKRVYPDATCALNFETPLDLVVATINPGDVTADWPLFVDKAPIDRQATAYFCRGYACLAPTSDPATVERQIAELVIAPSV